MAFILVLCFALAGALLLSALCLMFDILVVKLSPNQIKTVKVKEKNKNV